MSETGLIRRFLRGKWNLLGIHRQERVIKRAIAEKRYHLDRQIKDLHFLEIRDIHMDSQQVMTFVPMSRMIRLHPDVDSRDRTLALAMLLVYLSQTHAGSAFHTVPTYKLMRSDINSPTGPEDNGRWKEFMSAADLILPTQDFLDIARLFPNRVSYAVQRIMNVPPVLVEVRMNEFRNKTDHTQDPFLLIKKPAKKAAQ